MKRKKLSYWKEEAKRVFQLWVRTRDTNEYGWGNCCTCGKVVHYKQADGGHFIRATNMTVCFDERNCHLQCKGCNHYKGGAWENYLIFMRRKHGQKVIDELLTFKGIVCKRSVSDYQFLIEKYTSKIAEIGKEPK